LLQVCELEQVPQLETLRDAPQLSVPVHPPQARLQRAHHAASLSGTQAHTFVAWQVCGEVQVPQLLTVRGVPQLSFAVTAPHVLPSREQNAVFDSGVQAQTFDALQLVPEVQVPQLLTVRAAPQLSVPLTEPQFLPSREQNAEFVSGVQPHTLPALQLWPPLQVPQLLTVRATPQLSVPLTVPQFFPLRAQNATSVSATQAWH
jgi:hypothetical protein